jgi:hypothetical protein
MRIRPRAVIPLDRRAGAVYSGHIAGRAGRGVRLDFDMLKLGDVLKSLGVTEQ